MWRARDHWSMPPPCGQRHLQHPFGDCDCCCCRGVQHVATLPLSPHPVPHPPPHDHAHQRPTPSAGHNHMTTNTVVLDKVDANRFVNVLGVLVIECVVGVWMGLATRPRVLKVWWLHGLCVWLDVCSNHQARRVLAVVPWKHDGHTADGVAGSPERLDRYRNTSLPPEQDKTSPLRCVDG